MTPQEMLLKSKLSLMELAQEINNIKKACNIFGVSRQHYYDVKKRYDKYGIDGLKEKERRTPQMPNQTPVDIEKQVIKYTLDHPNYGKRRVACELLMKGVIISESTIRSIWKRHNLLQRTDRIKKFEENLRKDYLLLSESQIQLLAEYAKDLNEKHVISLYPGYLLCQDTFEVGYIKGVGKVFMQAVVDTYGSFGFAKLYTSKIALTAADMLVNNVLPYYSALGIPVQRILTDNGKEYCGNFPDHEYEFILDLFNIKHKRTKVRHPFTNGFVERFNRTVLEEFFIIAFRKKWYYSVEELQKDLDQWLVNYNFRRTHQGYRTKGRTPIQVLLDVSNRPKLLSM